jgi:hypothetical protein
MLSVQWVQVQLPANVRIMSGMRLSKRARERVFLLTVGCVHAVCATAVHWARQERGAALVLVCLFMQLQVQLMHHKEVPHHLFSSSVLPLLTHALFSFCQSLVCRYVFSHGHRRSGYFRMRNWQTLTAADPAGPFSKLMAR